MASMNQQNRHNNTYYRQNTTPQTTVTNRATNPSRQHNTYQYNYQQSNKTPSTHYTANKHFAARVPNPNRNTNPTPSPYAILPPNTTNVRATTRQSRFHSTNPNNKQATNTQQIVNMTQTSLKHTYPHNTQQPQPQRYTHTNTTKPAHYPSTSSYQYTTNTNTNNIKIQPPNINKQQSSLHSSSRSTNASALYNKNSNHNYQQPSHSNTKYATQQPRYPPQTSTSYQYPPQSNKPQTAATQPTRPTNTAQPGQPRYQYAPPQYQTQPTKPPPQRTAVPYAAYPTYPPQTMPPSTSHPGRPAVAAAAPPSYNPNMYRPPNAPSPYQTAPYGHQPPPNYTYPTHYTHPPPPYNSAAYPGNTTARPPYQTKTSARPPYTQYPHSSVASNTTPNTIRSTNERYKDWKSNRNYHNRDRFDKWSRTERHGKDRRYRDRDRDRDRDRYKDRRSRDRDRARDRDRRYRNYSRDRGRDRDRDRYSSKKRSRSRSRNRTKSKPKNECITENQQQGGTVSANTQQIDTVISKQKEAEPVNVNENESENVCEITYTDFTETDKANDNTQQLLTDNNNEPIDDNIPQNNDKTDDNEPDPQPTNSNVITNDEQTEQKEETQQKEETETEVEGQEEEQQQPEPEEDSAGIHALLLAARDEDTTNENHNSNTNDIDIDMNDDEDDGSDDYIDKKSIEQRKNVNYDKFANDDVSVKGDDIPSPITLFADCLSASLCTQQLLNNLTREHFSKPTPIQKHCLPILLQNRDVMACAQTGSGKTLAFLLPLIAQLLLNGEVSRVFFAGKTACALPLALIMAPTRELTIQIDEQVYKMTRDTWIRSFAVFGGQNYEDQAREIEKFQVDILCATPGRLMDMVDGCKVSLEYIKHLAFDEADNMLDLGFKDKVQQLVNERGMPDKSQRQTVMFSATFPDPIQQLAKNFLKEFVFVKVSNLASSAGPVTQIVKWVQESQKRETLIKDIAETAGKIIVFCGRRQIADSTCNHLKEKGISAGCLHGHMGQRCREETILKFKDDKFRILCATSVAARGLDFPSIEKVINFDMPVSIQNYTHRIGRTGRIGSNGIAISYFNRTSRSIAGALAQYLTSNNQKLPRWLNEMSWKR